MPARRGVPTDLSTVFPQPRSAERWAWDCTAFRLTLQRFRLVPERVHLREGRFAVGDAAARELPLDVAEPRDEAGHRPAQGLLGGHAELAGQVRGGEEDVPELVLDGLRVAGGDGLVQLAELLVELLAGAGVIGP